MTDRHSSPAMLTDMYELTMLDAALESGVADRPACFEAFTRRLPGGRGYGVAAGISRLAGLIPEFRFTSEEVDYLDSVGGFSERLLEHLRRFRFRGSVRGLREGDVYVPNTPVLRVDATFGEAVLIETLVLSVLNHDCAVASAAARMHDMAAGRKLIEMGGRRTHESAAVHAARAVWLVGFDATSNIAAGHRYGVPVAGTAAHAFVLSHRDEPAAFEAQIEAQGLGTTLLVDTYNIESGIDAALDAASRFGGFPGAIRIDSGDLSAEAVRARAQLDSAGAVDTKIVVSGDLDEFSISDLSESPVDAYGVGTRLVMGSGHPTASMVYKVVAVARRADASAALEPVGKTSANKATRAGAVQPYRSVVGGTLRDEVLVPDGRNVKLDGFVPAHVELVRDGVNVYPFDLSQDREFHQQVRDTLPPRSRWLRASGPVMTPAVWSMGESRIR